MNTRSKLIVLIISFAILAAGCSTSRYTYSVKPTPLVKGKTLYLVNDIKVISEEREGFLSQEQLTNIFREKITHYLQQNNILGKSKQDSYDLSVTLDYTRDFVIFSNTISYIHYYYTWEISKDGKTLATYTSGNMKAASSTVGGLNVLTKIGRSKPNTEVEPGYIDFFAGNIVKGDIMDVGD